jgi:hypothetical protein
VFRVNLGFRQRFLWYPLERVPCNETGKCNFYAFNWTEFPSVLWYNIFFKSQIIKYYFFKNLSNIIIFLNIFFIFFISEYKIGLTSLCPPKGLS